MPVEARRFFRGAACAIALSMLSWLALGGAYFGLVPYLTKATSPMTVARTIETDGSIPRLRAATSHATFEVCRPSRDCHRFISP